MIYSSAPCFAVVPPTSSLLPTMSIYNVGWIYHSDFEDLDQHVTPEQLDRGTKMSAQPWCTEIGRTSYDHVVPNGRLVSGPADVNVDPQTSYSQVQESFDPHLETPQSCGFQTVINSSSALITERYSGKRPSDYVHPMTTSYQANYAQFHSTETSPHFHSQAIPDHVMEPNIPNQICSYATPPMAPEAMNASTPLNFPDFSNRLAFPSTPPLIYPSAYLAGQNMTTSHATQEYHYSPARSEAGSSQSMAPHGERSSQIDLGKSEVSASELRTSVRIPSFGDPSRVRHVYSMEDSGANVLISHTSPSHPHGKFQRSMRRNQKSVSKRTTQTTWTEYTFVYHDDQGKKITTHNRKAKNVMEGVIYPSQYAPSTFNDVSSQASCINPWSWMPVFKPKDSCTDPSIIFRWKTHNFVKRKRSKPKKKLDNIAEGSSRFGPDPPIDLPWQTSRITTEVGQLGCEQDRTQPVT